MPETVTLTAEQEKLVHALVAAGRFPTAEAAISAGLKLLKARDEENEAKREHLRKLIQEGIDSGPAETWDVEEIIRDARRSLVAGE